MLGPKRFTDLRTGLPGISPNVLSQRLHELSEWGVVERRELPPPYGSTVYQLTEWGKGLETVLKELGRWGAESPALPRECPLSVNSLALSFRTMFDAEAAKGAALELELVVCGEPLKAEVVDSELTVTPGSFDHEVPRISGSSEGIAAATYDGASLDELIEDGVISISGDRATIERYLSCFKLPDREPAEIAPVVIA
jgi:hypothetical protein